MNASLVVGFVCALAAQASASTSEGRLVARDHGKPVDPHSAPLRGAARPGEAGTIDLPLAHTDVHVRIDGYLADATVTQRFTNPYADKIEAVYLFPLPTGAAVSEMTIAIGARTIRGTIDERAHATRVYEAARGKGLVAALVTEERPNLFTQQVANLEPHATVEVTLHYVERLAYEDGGYELVFPMVAGARSGADAATTVTALPAGTRSSHDIALAVDLDAGVPIEDLRSPSHRIDVTRPTPSRAHVAIAADDTIPNKDFVLRYRVAGRAPELGVLAYKDGAHGSFVMIAQPPASAAPEQIAPRELVFVLDTSSSMRGAPLAKSKDVIRHVLTSLGPDDTFQIVRFDDRASALGPGPIANKPRNIQLVLEWLARLDAQGTTDMTAGIEVALAVPHDPLRLRIVTFLTDGYIGDEDAILAKVAAHAGESRLFCFGVGSAVNRYLLEEMAAQGRGTAQFVRPDDDTATAARAFEARIAAPILTDVRIDWGGLDVADLTPRALPDLFLGQPLVIAGHYTRAGDGTVTVSGKQGGHDVRFQLRVSLPDHDASRPAIATVWARARIAELERWLVKKADPGYEKSILVLALENHLLTRFTAFVAVDDATVTKGGAARRVTVPVEVPDSVAGIQALGYGYGYGYGYGAGSAYGYGASMAISGSYTTSVATYGSIGYGDGVLGAPSALHHVVASAPTVVIGQPTVVGQLDAAIIRRYIKRNFERIRYCYEKQLVANPKLTGTVTATFTIGEDGHVIQANASGMDKDVAACVGKTLGDIEFPKSQGGGAVQVNYPFTFQVTP